MLNRMPDGHMVTTHTFVALVEGAVDVELLRGALRWAIARHPMLRARAEPSGLPKLDDIGPFVHAGKDGTWTWRPSNLSVSELAGRVLEVADAEGDFAEAWRRGFEASLDSSTFDFDSGPLWRLKLLRGGGPAAGRSAFLFSFVHALDDQRSANALLHELLSHMEAAQRGEPWAAPESLAPPGSVEQALLKGELDVGRLASYALSQAEAGGKPNVVLPSALRAQERQPRKNWALLPAQPRARERPLDVPVVPAEGDRRLLMAESVDPESAFGAARRRNLASLRTMPAASVAALRQQCRENNVTVSMAVAVAALLAASDISHDELDYGYEEYRLLLGVDMRRFAPGGDWTGGTVAYAAGALDFTMRLLPGSAAAYAAEHEDAGLRSPIGGVPFWDLARAAAEATRQWVERGHPAESTRLFDLGSRLLRLERVVLENAYDPSTLGRAYSVTVSNAGLFGHGQPDGTYGGLRLRHVFFGISQAVTGSLVAASCLTMTGGELALTAHGATPFVDRAALDAFADGIIRTLTIAAEEPVRQRSSVPRTDYPVEVRGGMPSFYPLETPKGALRCPSYDEVRSSRMPAFEVDKYLGTWYELAFHDITQFNGCGCTQFNMTRHGLVIEDMFTVTCPWPWRDGLEGPWLPGYSQTTKQRRLNQWTCNMTMYISPGQPGVMKETGFGQEFDNMVLEVWRDPEMAAETGYEYTRSIQFQCLSDREDGEITFTGINFLSRKPIVSAGMLQEMFVRARALGLEPYGSNDMHVVEHAGCRYPQSTHSSWMGDRPEWPFPVLTGELGAAV